MAPATWTAGSARGRRGRHSGGSAGSARLGISAGCQPLRRCAWPAREHGEDDETAISTSTTRRGGPATRGQWLVCKVPFGAWQNVIMVAALRHDRMIAPMTLNGAMTGDSFRSYITQVLGPTLRRGDIVVMDNVPLHR